MSRLFLLLPIVMWLSPMLARAEQLIVIQEESGWPYTVDHDWTIHTRDSSYGLRQFSPRSPHNFFDVDTDVIVGGSSVLIHTHAYVVLMGLFVLFSGILWLCGLAAARIYQRINERHRAA